MNLSNMSWLWESDLGTVQTSFQSLKNPCLKQPCIQASEFRVSLQCSAIRKSNTVRWCSHIRSSKAWLLTTFYTVSLFHNAALEQRAAVFEASPQCRRCVFSELPDKDRRLSRRHTQPSKTRCISAWTSQHAIFLLSHHRDTQQSHTVTFQPNIAVADIEWACREDEAHLRLNHPSFSPVSGVFWQNCCSAVLLILWLIYSVVSDWGLRIFDPFIWVYPPSSPSGSVLVHRMDLLVALMMMYLWLLDWATLLKREHCSSDTCWIWISLLLWSDLIPDKLRLCFQPSDWSTHVYNLPVITSEPLW